MGSWDSSGTGKASAEDLRDDPPVGAEEVADGGDGGAPGPKDGNVVGMLFVLGFQCAKGPDEGAGRGQGFWWDGASTN